MFCRYKFTLGMLQQIFRNFCPKFVWNERKSVQNLKVQNFASNVTLGILYVSNNFSCTSLKHSELKAWVPHFGVLYLSTFRKRTAPVSWQLCLVLMGSPYGRSDCNKINFIKLFYYINNNAFLDYSPKTACSFHHYTDTYLHVLIWSLWLQRTFFDNQGII